jgi:prepilin-type processing-associated H-X9-DG protein
MGNDASNPSFQYWGVIVRGPYFREGTDEWLTNFTAPITFARITDGASHTTVVTEKRINPDTYKTGSEPPDDRGWSDGWDFDTLRLAVCIPHSDSDAHSEFNFTAGSAHVAGMNTGFADGSVQFINYDIEPEMFNRLAHRSDGEQVNL